MNADQIRNLGALSEAIAGALCGAQNYLHVLHGFHDESKRAPAILEEHRDVLSQLWGGLFDALFALIGTIVDRTKGTNSLPNLLRDCRRYCATSSDGNGARKLCAKLEVQLGNSDALRKLEAWRMKVVAHRTAEGHLPAFYEENQMHLDEIAESLTYLGEISNEFGQHVLQTVYVFEDDPNQLRRKAAILFAKLG